MTNYPGIRIPTDAFAAAAALVEIERLNQVLYEVIHGPDKDEMSHRVYAYVSEATWWIASLDAQFCEENPDGSYIADRDEDEFGMLIPGILWIRDRISHQLPFTVVRDDRSFFDPKPGGVFHISAGYEWLPIAKIRSGHKRPKWEAIYQNHFEGRGIVTGPARIAVFLRARLEKDAACATELARIASVE